jgi:RNA polymerase sigma-70 factor (ECF subfamily)
VIDPFDGSRLTEALRSGQAALLRAAFNRHFDAMAMLARTLVSGGDEDVARLIEATWASIVTDFARKPPRSSARAWLFARLLSLRDTALDEPEPLGGQDESDPGFLPEDDEWEGHWAQFPMPWQPGADGWEHAPGGLAVVEAAVAALPLGERVVLLLRDLDGWTPAEVTALTGLPPDEERAVLFRARLRIRTALDPVLRTEQPRPGGTSHG